MSNSISGGCLCGAVRYECDAEPVAFLICHCRDCRYVSGGNAAAVVIAPKPAFCITSGEDNVRGHTSDSDKGNQVTRQFCVQCGTPLFSKLHAMPDVWGIKAGSLDDASRLTPSATLWTSTAYSWALIHEDIPRFEKDPS
ncbi:MAG: GFA family protein [Parvularculales bacterium]